MISMASRAILSPGLSICLRCQLRSSGLLPYWKISTFRKVPLAGSPPVTYRRWASTIEPNASEQAAVDNVPHDTASSPVEITSSKEGDAPVAEQAPPKPNRRPGLSQLENRNLLILEMPTRKPRKQPLFKMVEVPEEQLIKQYSYLLVFEENADAFELAIDMMRPNNPQVDPSDRDATKNIVSRKRFQQIQQHLGSQFTRPQLLGYVDTVHKAEHTQSVNRGIVKLLLLEHILKVLWKVEISEEINERMDLIVEKKLAMSKEDIFFLISQNGRNLRIWAQDHTARITVNLRDSSLSIEATMVNIEQLEQKIPELLKQKIGETVDLTALTRLTSFNKSCVPTISKLTGTYIQPVVGSETVYRVSALGPDRGPLEDARRLMFDSHVLSFRTTSSLVVDSSFSPGAKSSDNLRGSLYRIAEDQALTWLMRGRDWSRWRSVKTKIPFIHEMSPSQQKIAALIKQWAPPPDKKPEFVDPDKRLKLNLDEISIAEGMEMVKTLLDSSGVAEEQQHSHLLPQPEYTATLGFLLHNSAMQPAKANSIAEVLKEDPERVFCENIPGLTYLVSDHKLVSALEKPAANPFFNRASDFDLDPETGEPRMNFGPTLVTPKVDEGNPNNHSMLIRFSPSPWEHPEDFETYPPVEMEVEVDSITGDVRNPKVVAVHSNSVVDMMMPAKDCDVRFRRRLVVPLHVGKSDKIVKSAQEGRVAKEFSKEEAAAEGSGPTEGEEEAVKSKSSEEATGDVEPAEAPSTPSLISPHLPNQSSSVDTYLANSKLNPTINKRLQPAAELNLQIPAYLCSASPEIASSLTDTVLVTYIFTSISYATTTPLSRHDYHLNKREIEGGLSGGKKVQLEMEFKKIPGKGIEGKDSVEENREWGTWTESVLGLVGRLGQVLGTRRNIFVGRK
ncbi:mitochondrial inner-membrane-bound regulator-domain-containing protein [Tirmania nivea]|nr:mitochondrial inner-membrane-bound regulator-domain-containing protein [Tirmania nivea]